MSQENDDANLQSLRYSILTLTGYAPTLATFNSDSTLPRSVITRCELLHIRDSTLLEGVPPFLSRSFLLFGSGLLSLQSIAPQAADK